MKLDRNPNIARRIRELRLERGLQQAEVARHLGISPAYLNLIEKGKRSAQLPILWKALALYGVEVEKFMSSLGERSAPEALQSMLDEPLLRSLGITDEELAEFSGEPRRTAMLVALFNLYKNTRTQLDTVLAQLASASAPTTPGTATRATAPTAASGGHGYSPFDELTDFLESHKNYFPELESEARRIRQNADLGPRMVSDDLIAILRSRDVSVLLHPPGRGSVVRRYDPKRSRLELSTEMSEQRKKFQLATTLGLRVLDESNLDERLARSYRPKHAETARLIKIHLANYFAGAVLLPYREFIDATERTRYDVELLSDLFEMSYEAVAHRLCNLADPKRRGIPMHFVRSDVAGNISKKYAATGLRIPEGSGSCGKWAVHMAFLSPSVVTKQYSMMPDGVTYFCFAKVAAQPQRGSLVRGTAYSIGLGVHADAAKHLAYAQDLPLTDPQKIAIPVGTTCRFCERADCNQRAAPSYKFAFNVDEYTKKDNFFSPLLDHD